MYLDRTWAGTKHLWSDNPEYTVIHFLLQKEVIHHIEDVGPEWSCTSLAMFKAYVVRIRMHIAD